MYPTWVAMTPMGAMADPTDLQGAAVFLGSAASDFMTGTDIVVDGGYLSFWGFYTPERLRRRSAMSSRSK